MRIVPAVLALLLAGPWTFAGDAARRWYFGWNGAFHTTSDRIDSNADEPGDPRPADFAGREISIQDTASYGLTAGFGMSRRFSLQLDAGCFAGRVGTIDGWLRDRFPFATNPADPTVLNGIRRRETTVPIVAGRVTELPVVLSGVLRFRTDRHLSPYVGLGGGMIFADVEGSSDLAGLNARLARLRITGEQDETLRDLVPERFEPLRAQGRIPFTYPVSVDVRDSFVWQVTGGMEHFINERFSIVAELRYLSSAQAVSIDLRGEDQVNVSFFSEKLFRPDGSLRVFNQAGEFPNPYVDPNDPSKGTVRCAVNTVGDFDGDGHADDICYFNDTSSREDDPLGVFVIQGGRIDLSGFTAQIGLRVYF